VPTAHVLDAWSARVRDRLAHMSVSSVDGRAWLFLSVYTDYIAMLDLAGELIQADSAS
jgi:hypothetical protein